MSSAREQIEKDVKENKVMLYMKGTPDAPMCGFSAQVVNVLKTYNVPFKSFNVLEDESIRQAIKEYADWPTIPQLYVNGEFIGGCDIMMELHQSGELKKLLETAAK
ncbi:MAG: monothiol glutaredoxin, Grx4 family [Omnitrophica WOR_2 bacterium RIFCSPHIGHO2_01_FULL_48_9]|nr:MAG: monothiol glutaredoxin, Grx4 family [Omnitrophica WOR_2 bacterium RIFCSPHIGHO2_01_FULL_48_9]